MEIIRSVLGNIYFLVEKFSMQSSICAAILMVTILIIAPDFRTRPFHLLCLVLLVIFLVFLIWALKIIRSGYVHNQRK